MTEARLEIGAAAYSLLVNSETGWRPLAALAGGAGAVLRADRQLDAFAFEHAIEVVEDWLMPHAARLRDCDLTIQDDSGRLGDGLSAVLAITSVRWSVPDVESMFGRVVDLATGRRPPPALEHRHAFVADLLLIRELAHHGKLREVRLDAPVRPRGTTAG